MADEPDPRMVRAAAMGLLHEWDLLKEAIHEAEGLEGQDGFPDALWRVTARFGPFLGAHGRFSATTLNLTLERLGE